MVYVWVSKDNLCGSVVTLYIVGPEAQTRFGRLGGKHLYLLSHLTSPQCFRKGPNIQTKSKGT